MKDGNKVVVRTLQNIDILSHGDFLDCYNKRNGGGYYKHDNAKCQ